MINLDPRLIWDMVTTVIAMLAALYAWLLGRNRATASEINALDQRATRLEAALQNMPSHADLTKLNREIAELSGDIKAIGQSINGLQATLPRMEESLGRINDYLLNHKN